MYPDELFLKNDRKLVESLIHQNPLANLITSFESLLCSHIPVLIDASSKQLRLFGHLARQNTQSLSIQRENKALLVFRGPHAFVSASWYKQRGKISTWDYSAVHVRVKCTPQSDDELLSSLKKLYLRFEENETVFYDIDKSSLNQNLKHIIGFWFDPVDVRSIAKWHQDYPREDVEMVVHHLKNEQKPNQSVSLAADIAKEHGLKLDEQD